MCGLVTEASLRCTCAGEGHAASVGGTAGAPLNGPDASGSRSWSVTGDLRPNMWSAFLLGADTCLSRLSWAAPVYWFARAALTSATE